MSEQYPEPAKHEGDPLREIVTADHGDGEPDDATRHGLLPDDGAAADA